MIYNFETTLRHKIDQNRLIQADFIKNILSKIDNPKILDIGGGINIGFLKYRFFGKTA